MLTDYLEFSIDKFQFRIATDRFYNAEGLWVKPENDLIRIGISDYTQQRSGDVAFVEIKPKGSMLELDEELAVIETIKVNISLTSPVSGKVKEVNPEMETSPEVINQDPYGEGWLVTMEAADWDTIHKHLLKPDEYFEKIKAEADREVNSE
jgi:glycine cleavage system H protein